MIITGDNEVVLGSKAQSVKFGIASSAKAFKILSSGLYKNKIRAVVRELSCNCIDAHFLNGFKGAFQINVPGELDPRFIIRDFGPGLSKSGLENLYTTYFASTKTGSNDFIGALGLGSKSPFAYTDTFTVVSYHDGMVYGYTAMLDKGEPVIRPIFEEPMKEGDKTGLEITVPVKTSDINMWKHEISYVIRPFGADKVELVGSKIEPKFFPEFDEYYGTSQRMYDAYEQYGLFAVYGNIVYPLSGVPGLSSTWMQTRHNLVFIKFPLGELDIAASREELSLDEQTIANIKSRIIKLDKKVMQADIKEWQESTNERKVLREITNLNYDAKNILSKYNTLFTKNKLTKEQLTKKYKVNSEFVQAGVVYEVTADPRMLRLKPSTSGAGISIGRMFGHDTPKLTIIIDDNKKGRLPAFRALSDCYYDNKHPVKSKIIKDNPNFPKQGEYCLFVNPASEMEMDILPVLLEFMGEDEVVMLRTSEIYDAVEEFIPKRVPGTYVPKPKAPSAVRHYRKNDSWLSEDLYLSASESDEIDGYALFVRGYSYEFMDRSFGSMPNADISKIYTLTTAMGLHEFYTVRPTLHKRVIKDGQCQDLLVDIIEKFAELVDEVDYDYYVANSGSAQRYMRHVNSHPEKLGFLIQYINEVGKESKESKALMTFKSYLGAAQVYAIQDVQYNNTYGDMLSLCQNITAKLTNFAFERAHKCVEKFENENIIVSEYLSNRYSLSDEAVAEIVKLMGQ